MRLAIPLLLITSLLPAAGLSSRDKARSQIQQRTGVSPPPLAGEARRPFSLPPGIVLDDKLTSEAAVAIALWNNTALEADLAAMGLSDADLADARLLRNPNLWSLIPVGSKPFEVLLNWPIEDLWQRKKRVLAAEKNLDTVVTALVQNGLNLVRDVRVAHADLWLAGERLRILSESARLRRRIAQLTERRRQAGDASSLDVTIAQADAQSAAELERRAAGDVEIARTRLRMLLGLRDDPRPLVAAQSGSPPGPPPPPAELVQAAYSSRPDLRAAELAIEAGAYRAKWQRSRIFNVVTPILSVKETGSPLSAKAGPGFQVELPIFNRNQGQIARADAEVIQLAWRYAALRDRVEMEVREANARLDQARISLEQLRRDLMPVVEQAISQTETAYRNGDASYLNVLESSRQRFDAALRELDAQAAFDRAFAELERSVGKKL